VRSARQRGEGALGTGEISGSQLRKGELEAPPSRR
jgi:hypothetical protein